MAETCREPESWKCVTCWQESGITLPDVPQTKNTTSRVETTVIKPLKATKATKSIRRRPLCEHGQQRHLCKDCGGASICVHGRRRHVCKDCGGNSLCLHGRQRHLCKDCGGASICPHGRRRNYCKDCAGTSICTHGRQCYTCKDCMGMGNLFAWGAAISMQGMRWCWHLSA